MFDTPKIVPAPSDADMITEYGKKSVVMAMVKWAALGAVIPVAVTVAEAVLSHKSGLPTFKQKVKFHAEEGALARGSIQAAILGSAIGLTSAASYNNGLETGARSYVTKLKKARTEVVPQDKGPAK